MLPNVVPEIVSLRIMLVVWIIGNVIAGIVSSDRWLHWPAALGGLAFWVFYEVSRLAINCFDNAIRLHYGQCRRCGGRYDNRN